MSREYQNGDGFGYLLSFRRQGSAHWQTARVPGADAQYFVYSNDSVRPYTPFEVKIRSYNRRGSGPESLTALVYSAEEGRPRLGPLHPTPHPAPGTCPWGIGWEVLLPSPTPLSSTVGWAGHLGSKPLASFRALATWSPPQVWGRRREALWESPRGLHPGPWAL